jgi:hypothetical protein
MMKSVTHMFVRIVLGSVMVGGKLMLDEANSTHTSAPAEGLPATVMAATEPADATTDDPTDDEAFYTSGMHSLAAATRLVDPMRLNNLVPEEILPRHLRRANREVRRARRGLSGIERDAHRVVHTARLEAQRGQRLARMVPSRRRARHVQMAIRRADGLNSYYSALEDERARYARKVAAARDLLTAWNQEKQGLHRRVGDFFAGRLRRTTLAIGRVERVTRERLDEARRGLAHVAVAEEAMRRDADMVRMDPVNFRRFAGRGRWGVRLGIVALILALVAFIYPPWAPPHLLLTCTIPTSAHNACASVHASSSLAVVNQGNGLLVGWATITISQPGAAMSQTIAVVVLPHGTQSLNCGDYGGCAAPTGSTVHVQFTTSGGSSSVAVVP